MAKSENTENQIFKILIFEWLTGGGCWCDSVEPSERFDLLRQGQQMLGMVSADFTAAGFEVLIPVDSRIDLELPGQHFGITDAVCLKSTLRELTEKCDFVLVIAPESDNCLVDCLRWIEDFQGKWLNPSLRFTCIASDKNQMQEFLAARNIPVPRGTRGELWDSCCESFADTPLVVKPFAGCGGEGNFLVTCDSSSASDAVFKQRVSPLFRTQQYRIEELVEGTAVSVGVLGWDDQRKLQKPVRQNFTDLPIGIFKNCSDDLPDALANRAIELAEHVASILPSFRGYVGVDMVVGIKDVVIEINPRVTVSYAAKDSPATWFLSKILSVSSTQ